jgi:hypothetical protein
MSAQTKLNRTMKGAVMRYSPAELRNRGVPMLQPLPQQSLWEYHVELALRGALPVEANPDDSEEDDLLSDNLKQ